MAENTTIRDKFFDSLAKGAKWDVGVSINRTNPLPLDQYSVFKSEADLDTYIKGAFSYPGQIVAVVDETETKIYYLAENKIETKNAEGEVIKTEYELVKAEVGSMPEVDNKSIEIRVDENGNEFLTLVGFGQKYIDEDDEGNQVEKDFEAGLQLTTVSTNDGIKLAWIKPDTSTVEGLNTAVNGLTTRMSTAEGDIDALEAKFASMGGIFNFAGSFTSAEFANKKAEDYDIGDVVLVDAKDEYLCVEKTRSEYVTSEDVEAIAGKTYYIKDTEGTYVKIEEVITESPAASGYYEIKTITEKVWEQFGDPEGVAELKGDVADLKVRATAAEGKIKINEDAIGLPYLPANPETGAPERKASGLYDYANTVATEKANAAQAAAEATAAAALAPVATQVGTNTSDIATLNTNLATKADKADVEVKLAKKLDKEEYIPRINELEAKVSAKAENSYVNEELAKKANISDVTTATNGLSNRLTQAELDIDDLELAVGQKGADGKYPTTSLTGKVETLEANDKNQDQKISGLTSGLGSITDDANAATAFGKAAEAKELATQANTALSTKAEKKYVDDALALKADLQYVVNEISGVHDQIGNEISDIKVFVNEGLETKADAGETKTALDSKANTADVEAKIGDLGKQSDGITDHSVKTYVDTVAATKVDNSTYADDKIAINAAIDLKANSSDLTSAVDAINAKIGTLGNVMNFVGELEEITVTEGETTTTKIVIKTKNTDGTEQIPENGDVGFLNAFEYVYINGEWVKFGDTSAEAERIGLLENSVNGADGKSGLIKDVADLKAEDILINAEIAAIKSNANTLATKAELEAEAAARAKADTDEAEARAEADANEATIRAKADEDEAKARAEADSALRTYIDSLLEWGTFDPPVETPEN